MQKTRLGVTVGLMGAALYFSGLMSFFVLIIMAGYVLLFETDEWLKKSAVKAVAVVIAFSLISVLVSIGNDIFSTLNGIIALFKTSFRLSWPLNLNTIILGIVNILEKFILIILGFKALSQGSVSVGTIDKVINNNM